MTRSLAVLPLACALLVVGAVCAWADDLGVTRIEVEERESGRIEVVARVPVRWAMLLPPPELLGRGLFETAGYVREGGGGAKYVLEAGESGLGLDDVILLPWQRQAVLARIRLADGTAVRRFFRRTGRGIEIPIRDVKPDVAGPLERMRDATLAGVRHVAGGWAHLALVLLLGLGAGLRRGGGLLLAFLLGQLAALALAQLGGLRLPSAVGELALVLAVVFLARDALRPGGVESRMGGILACAGVAHGLGLASIVLPGGTSLGLLLVLLGIDGAQLVGVAIVAMAATGLRRLPFARVLGHGVAYVVGVGATAVLALIVIGDERAAAFSASPAPSPSTQEREMGPLPLTRSTPASRLLAPRQADAPLQSFLTVEPFEVRCDVLLRLEGAPDWTGLGSAGGDWIETDVQTGLLQRLGERVLQSTAIRVDGRDVTPIVDRVDFVTVGPKGTLPRTERVRESLAEAQVGVVLTALTKGMPQEVSLAWTSLPEGVREVPASVTDPETSRAATLERGNAVLHWRNELREDPIPTVTSVVREPPRLPIPWLALAPLLLAVVLVVLVARGRVGVMALAAARVLLVAALLVAPLVQTSVALPNAFGSTPSSEQAGRVIGALLTNVYRSLSFRDEGDVYDRLALSVDGDQLTAVYLEQSRGLAMAERGGARARVEAVEVLEVTHVEAAEGSGFVAEVVWSVGGSVSHFGHRHFRQNRYRARVTVMPFGDTWKIKAFDVLDMARAL